MRTRISAALAGCALAAIGLVGAGAGQAQAAALAFTSEGCIPEGGSIVDCHAFVTGGTGVYTWTWSASSDSSPDVEIYCDAGHSGTVSVTVRDSVGASITGNINYYCKGGAPR